MLKHSRMLLTGTVSLFGPNTEQAQIRGAGERVEVDVSRCSLRLALVSRLPSRSARLRWLLAIQPALRESGLSVEILVDGCPVGFFDGTSKGSPLGRLLGFGPVDIRLYPLLLAWLHRPPKRNGG